MVQVLREPLGGRAAPAGGTALHPLVRGKGDDLLVVVLDADGEATKLVPTLTQRLTKAGFQGPSALLTWQSEVRSAAGGVLGVALEGLAGGGLSLLLAGMKAAASGPAKAAASLQSYRHAGAAAQGLLELLQRQPGASTRRLSFLGFSAGAEVVRLALSRSLRVHNVALVAGASSRDAWAPLVDRLSGRLVNLHSGADTELLSLPFDAVGQGAGMPAVSHKVVNVVAPGWAHATYASSFDTVLAKVRDLL